MLLSFNGDDYNLIKLFHGYIVYIYVDNYYHRLRCLAGYFITAVPLSIEVRYINSLHPQFEYTSICKKPVAVSLFD